MSTKKDVDVKHTASLHWLILLSLIAVAAALRLFDLNSNGIWEDEAWSWFQSNQTFSDMIISTALDNHPPLYNVILNLSIGFFGDSETAMRVPSVILGTLAVFLTYRVGALLWDETTGLLACVLITLSGFHIWYSQEARMYALLSCTSVYYVLTVVRATSEPSKRHLLACILAGALLLYSHVYGFFVFTGINLFVLASFFTRSTWPVVNWKAWVISQALACAAFSPWLMIILERANQIRNEGFWIPDLSLRLIFGNLATAAGGVAAFIVFFVLALIAISSLRFSATTDDNHGEVSTVSSRFLSLFSIDWRISLVLVWCVSSLFFGIVTSIVIDQTVLDSRYLLGSLPAFLLLSAVGIRKLQFMSRFWLVALLLAVLVSIPSIHPASTPLGKSDARELVSALKPELKTGDRVFVYVPWRVHVYQYYLKGTGARSQPMDDLESITQWAPEYDRFWIMVAQLQDPETTDLLERAGETHQLAYSKVQVNSQAYLFLRKQSLPTR